MTVTVQNNFATKQTNVYIIIHPVTDISIHSDTYCNNWQKTNPRPSWTHLIHQQIEGSVHKGSISKNPNFSGNKFLCFASSTS